MKRKESRNVYFRQRIPKDVVDRARGTTITVPIGESLEPITISPKAMEVKVSLRTADPSTAKARQGIAAAYLGGYWQSLRNGATSLSHKQCVALSGELFSDFVSATEDFPGSAKLWAKVRADNDAARSGNFGSAQLMIPSPERTRQSLEDRFGPLIDVILAKRGLVVDDDSRGRLLKQAVAAMNDAAAKIEKFADGDYSDDGTGSRFPKWDDAVETAGATKSSITINDLLDGWWKEAQLRAATESTREGYERTIRYFIGFLKHDDATKVTPDDVVAFREHRLHTPNPRTGKPASPKTVKDSDLAALKSVFGWGKDTRKIPLNPAEGITVKLGRKVALREERCFTEAETTAILGNAKAYQRGPKEGEKVALAKRWVPWLCAYTGARIGEMCQLRKQDIDERHGVPVFVITPEAGTTKNKKLRTVPIHQHLVDQGFLTFVQSRPDGYLFLNADMGGDWRGPWRTTKNKVRDSVREVYHDPHLQPNHGWRHTFKTIAADFAPGNERTIDAIVGHAPRTEGEEYGEKRVQAMQHVLNLFPRFRT